MTQAPKCEHGREERGAFCPQCHPEQASSAKSDLLCVGDVVIPADHNYPFASGCGLYTHAIVIAADPIQMVSERADMLWRTDVKPERLKVVGKATPEQLKLCMTRLNT